MMIKARASKIQFLLKMVLLIAFTHVCMNCAVTKDLFTFTSQEIIKPLETYNTPITRDVAQMVYPGFQELREEMQMRLPPHAFRFSEHGLRVEQVEHGGGVSEGFYVTIDCRINKGYQNVNTYLQQAGSITNLFLHHTMVGVSRDWNNMLSPAFAGIQVIYQWKNNNVQFYFLNEHVQSYLNGEISLQEFVDMNWIEGMESGKKTGRIELNNLETEQI